MFIFLKGHLNIIQKIEFKKNYDCHLSSWIYVFQLKMGRKGKDAEIDKYVVGIEHNC